MADNPSTAARPAPTEAQIKIREDAKRLAKEQGLDWKALSVEERKQLKRTIRQQSRQKEA